MHRSNSRTARREAFRQMLRLHASDWVWQRASDLFELGQPPVRGLDVQAVGRVVSYLYDRAGIVMNWPGKPRGDHSDIAAAHGARERGGLAKDVLQAYLLTPLSFADVGDRVGMPAAVIEAYHQVFFDVRDRFKASGWIDANAIGYRRFFRDPSTLGMVLRKFAYFAGEHALAKLIAYVLRNHPELLAMPAPPVTLAEVEEQAIRRVLALELLPLDERAVMLHFHLHADLLLREATYGTVPAGDVGGDWLNNITFVSKESELQTILDPKWSPLLYGAA